MGARCDEDYWYLRYPSRAIDYREDTFKPQPIKQTTMVELVNGVREKVTNIGKGTDRMVGD